MDEGLPIVPCGNGICKALTPYICSTMSDNRDIYIAANTKAFRLRVDVCRFLCSLTGWAIHPRPFTFQKKIGRTVHVWLI